MIPNDIKQKANAAKFWKIKMFSTEAFSRFWLASSTGFESLIILINV